MPRVALTDLTLKNLKPEKRATYFDMSTPGFAVRATPSGAKTFVIVHGPERARKWEKIGTYPTLSLAKAREAARNRLSAIQLGIKPEAPVMTFEDAYTLFLASYKKKNREKTVYEMERIVKRHLMPKLRRHTVAEITTQDVATIIDKLLPTPAECAATFTAARTLLRWIARRRLIGQSPLDGLQLPVRSASREHVLSDDELGAIWRASGSFDGYFGPLVRCLILTGQRKSQIARLRGEWIDPHARTITWPSEEMKGGKPHTIAYGEMLAAALKDLPKVGYLFPARGKAGPFNGFSKSKATLDKKLGENVRPFTLHDLRRTFATNLAEMGIAPHINERILAHSSGVISGVSAIYNRHHFLPEIKNAVQKWETRLQTLISK